VIVCLALKVSVSLSVYFYSALLICASFSVIVFQMLFKFVSKHAISSKTAAVQLAVRPTRPQKLGCQNLAARDAALALSICVSFSMIIYLTLFICASFSVIVLMKLES
jgi:hypothetical protein